MDSQPGPPPNSPANPPSPAFVQGLIDHALEMDIQLFASLGWLNGRILDGSTCGEESDSEPLA